MSRSEAGRLGAIKTNELWLARYKQNPKLCKFCLKKLPYEKRKNVFCNHACSASFNNKGICRYSTEKKIQYPKELCSRVSKEQICNYCQKIVHDKKIRTYCSQECRVNHQWALRKKQIETLGIENSARSAKRFLLENRGNQCEICKNEKWCGSPIPLIMDHIDGNAENNKLTNLRLVCGNCDMQLPTYKGRNKGNGRHNRRKRYQEGKSF